MPIKPPPTATRITTQARHKQPLGRAALCALSLFFCVGLYGIGLAQTAASKDTEKLLLSSTSELEQPLEQPSEQSPSQLQIQLLYIQNSLSQKLDERRELGNKIEQVNEQDKADVQRDAAILTTEIKQLRDALESLAVGDVDTKLFSSNTVSEEQDWKKDVALIAQPVLDSLKEITEKPRQIKDLNSLINAKQKELDESTKALENLSASQIENKRSALALSINRLEQKWLKRQERAQQSIDIAKIQLATLEGDQPLFKTIYDTFLQFIKGRGLTIALAILAAVIVWATVRLILLGYRHMFVDKKEESSRTRYRLAKYSVHAFTAILVLIAVFIVFYERHDVLLLGLLILFIVGLALSTRQLLPRYVVEARLLLNLGSCREKERVLYNDLPWRIESINMHSILRNPELNGVLRLPLGEIAKLYSRPIGRESWFPTSKGDVVYTQDKLLLEVLNQNPDTVELRKRGGEIVFVPTATFYGWTMTNLSRSGTFGVSIAFGIDYEQQDISLSDVPTLLCKNVRAALERSNLNDKVIEVEVELEAADDSSLRYWIFVTMDSSAAKSYQRLQRIIQSACVETCTSENWNIPFPHLSVVQKPTTQQDILQANKAA